MEIVVKLQALGLLEVIYTCNAKEFLTPEHLKREIQDEVRVKIGRIPIPNQA